MPRLILRRKYATRGELETYTGLKGAVISSCGLYRYVLWRRWGEGLLLPIMMLNPSKADAQIDDQTIAKCVGFAKLYGFAGILIVNMFAYRATDPKELDGDHDISGPENDAYVQAALQYARNYSIPFVFAWGSNARRLGHRTHYSPAWAKQQRVRARAFKLLNDGHPGHPLYLSYKLQLAKL